MHTPRLVLTVMAAALAVGPVASASADPTRAGDSASLKVSAAGKRALRGVTVQPVAPAKAGVSLPARTVTVAGGQATVELGGALRFRAGKRSVTASALRLTAQRTSSTLSGKLGRSRVTLFSARGTATLDSRGVSFTGARLSLTRAAATRLKSALKLKRTPSVAALGTLTLKAASATPPPAPPVTQPAPAPTATATPAPDPTPPGCPSFTATPAQTTDWFACDLPGNGDLKSWTNYVQRAFPPACALGSGSITTSDGAQRIQAESAYDHRFGVGLGVVRPDGSATIQLTGTVTYTMPAHGIDESIGDLRIEIAPGGAAAQVFANGRSNPRTGTLCPGPAVPYTGQHVLDLDLTGITPVTSDGVTRWVHVPATIAAGTDLVGGGVYGAGANWGAFTIAVAEP